MPEIENNNPAGRLYHRLQAIQATGNNDPAAFAGAIGIPFDWDAIRYAIIDMRAEYRLVEEAVESMRINPPKYKLWSTKLADIKRTLSNFNVNEQSKSVQYGILPSALVSLEVLSTEFQSEPEVPEDELAKLRSLCKELWDELESNKEMNRALRQWLLELVRAMMDGINRSRIRGGKAFRRELYHLIGEISEHYEQAKEAKTEAPDFWQKLVLALDIMNRISDVAGKYQPAIDKILHSLPVVTQFLQGQLGG